MSAENTSKRNKGQFEKGNPGGPGNPHAKQVARIRATLLAALEPATLYEIVCRLIERAVNGNLEAIKILLSYTIGRPGKSNDLIELLSEHYPPSQEPAGRDQESDHRQQTDETAGDRHQTVETDAPAVGQVADLPKAPQEGVPRTPNRHQTDQTVESRRQQTDQTVEPHRHQTDQTVEPRRHQTDQTVEPRRHQTDQTATARARHRQQTAQSARILTAGLGGGRHQTGQTDETPRHRPHCFR